MKAAYVLKKIRIYPSCLLIFAFIFTTCGCNTLHNRITTWHQLSSLSKNLGYAPIVVFPLKTATGKPELNWLSIGLQESLTSDLYNISELNTKPLLDLNPLIKNRCYGMVLSCITGLNANSDTPSFPLKETDWENIATKAKLGQFIWGSYRQEGEKITV